MNDMASYLREIRTWQDFENAVKALTLVMEEIEQGSPNLKGGQSRGWKIFHWVCRRYQVPPHISRDICNGYMRWMQ